VALVQHLQAALPAINFSFPPAAGSGDFVLVVCGCPARCAYHGDLTGKKGELLISPGVDYETVCQTLRNALGSE
jgi:hypothetical protein